MLGVFSGRVGVGEEVVMEGDEVVCLRDGLVVAIAGCSYQEQPVSRSTIVAMGGTEMWYLVFSRPYRGGDMKVS